MRLPCGLLTIWLCFLLFFCISPRGLFCLSLYVTHKYVYIFLHLSSSVSLFLNLDYSLYPSLLKLFTITTDNTRLRYALRLLSYNYKILIISRPEWWVYLQLSILQAQSAGFQLVHLHHKKLYYCFISIDISLERKKV